MQGLFAVGAEHGVGSLRRVFVSKHRQPLIRTELTFLAPGGSVTTCAMHLSSRQWYYSFGMCVLFIRPRKFEWSDGALWLGGLCVCVRVVVFFAPCAVGGGGIEVMVGCTRCEADLGGWWMAPRAPGTVCRPSPCSHSESRRAWPRSTESWSVWRAGRRRYVPLGYHSFRLPVFHGVLNLRRSAAAGAGDPGESSGRVPE